MLIAEYPQETEEFDEFQDRIDFEDFILNLQSEMDNANASTWYAGGRCIGWRNLSGHKIVETDDARELLNAITPNCDYTIRLNKDEKDGELSFVLYHHDSPTGEFYTLFPLKVAEEDMANGIYWAFDLFRYLEEYREDKLRYDPGFDRLLEDICDALYIEYIDYENIWIGAEILKHYLISIEDTLELYGQDDMLAEIKNSFALNIPVEVRLA